MYYSLEVRVPFLDREVIKVATRVDWRSCLDLQTRTAKIPLRTWLRGPLRSISEEMVLSRREVLGPGINRSAIRELFEQHLCNRIIDRRGAWLLLSLCLWEDKVLKPAIARSYVA
jgi:asparagine synthase (glutamine-hydrolysing)